MGEKNLGQTRFKQCSKGFQVLGDHSLRELGSSRKLSRLWYVSRLWQVAKPKKVLVGVTILAVLADVGFATE